MSLATLTGHVSITDTDLFRDIISLLKDLSEQDETISQRLAEIMSRHSTEYSYSVKYDKEEEYGTMDQSE